MGMSFALIASILAPVSVAFADYAAFQNTYGNPAPVDGTNITLIGLSGSSRFDLSYLATTTVTQFDRLDLALCRSGGTSAGSINLEVRYNSTSSAVLASSTVLSAGNVVSDGTCATGVVNNATSTTFVLNNNLQWVSGVTVFFTLTFQGTAGSYYITLVNKATYYPNNLNYFAYADNELMYPAGLGKTYGWIGVGRGLGTSPTNQNQGVIYNASGTAVICTTFDVGCYITTSISFLFTPDDASVQRYRDLTFASSSPFGYVYDIPDMYETLLTASATPIVMSLDPDTMYDTLDTIATSTYRATTTPVVYFNSCWASTWPSDPYGTYIMPLWIACLWFGFMWEMYALAHRIF